MILKFINALNALLQRIFYISGLYKVDDKRKNRLLYRSDERFDDIKL